MHTPIDPDVADEAPRDDRVTSYDEQHFVTYLRLLDAEKAGADWQEVARVVLHRDASIDDERSYRCWKSHLDRAQWLSKIGYTTILRQAAGIPRNL
ncbi:DNA -binding domain-containing protein [Cohaesibacter haloalkalitolerans]|uniref:DNA -binding domain-containing protein n=1 Tax=Cohaesibacter haloalkalitolerans TaxID=1162980 RepID=UPI000E65DAFD|nr:DUF2285 domain-containing protein [Cohaesibacter haloalkalitolerans]